MADVTPRSDGTFVLKPHVPDSTCDTWIDVQDAAKLIGVGTEEIYNLVKPKEPYLVSRRPLERKIVISLKSVLEYRRVTVNPSFWTDGVSLNEHVAKCREAIAALLES
jgi:hypothetical protein